MFNTVIGVLAIRPAPPGNQVLITGPVNNLVGVNHIVPPTNLSNADNDIVAISHIVPPVSLSNADGDIVAISAFAPQVHLTNLIGT